MLRLISSRYHKSSLFIRTRTFGSLKPQQQSVVKDLRTVCRKCNSGKINRTYNSKILFVRWSSMLPRNGLSNKQNEMWRLLALARPERWKIGGNYVHLFILIILIHSTVKN